MTDVGLIAGIVAGDRDMKCRNYDDELNVWATSSRGGQKSMIRGSQFGLKFGLSQFWLKLSQF